MFIPGYNIYCLSCIAEFSMLAFVLLEVIAIAGIFFLYNSSLKYFWIWIVYAIVCLIVYLTFVESIYEKFGGGPGEATAIHILFPMALFFGSLILDFIASSNNDFAMRIVLAQLGVGILYAWFNPLVFVTLLCGWNGSLRQNGTPKMPDITKAVWTVIFVAIPIIFAAMIISGIFSAYGISLGTGYSIYTQVVAMIRQILSSLGTAP